MTTTPLSRLPWHPADWLTCMVSPMSVENSGGGSAQFNDNNNGEAGGDTKQGKAEAATSLTVQLTDPLLKARNEGADKTSLQFEVVAVIPVEFFTPKNREMVRKELDLNRWEPADEGKNSVDQYDAKQICKHIKNFSVYEYTIFVATSNELSEWRREIWNIISDQMKKKPELTLEGEDEFTVKFKSESYNTVDIQFEVMIAMPYKGDSITKTSDENPDMKVNTGATIVIAVKVFSSINMEEKSNAREDLANILKAIGDSLNIAINDSEPKTLIEIEAKVKDEDANPLVKKIYTNVFKEAYGLMVDEAKNTLESIHDHIEINYVFTFFICNHFKFHIITNVVSTDDNIKYSGNAWFLREHKIYKSKAKNSEGNYEYISELFYNDENTDKDKYNDNPEAKHNWIVEKLIPEAQVRPKEMYYVPKQNGGGYNDFSSILLKLSNKLCCFIKEKYTTGDLKEQADDRNRIIAMQIIVNAFWHRMTDFSRVMGQMCLQEDRGAGEESKVKMSNLNETAKENYLNQIYTTPTLKEQIADINSTDQDVATLITLASSDKMKGAKDYFNERKEIYLKLRSEEDQKRREKKVNDANELARKADQNIQIAVAILALITIPIGLVEILTSPAPAWVKVVTILFIGTLFFSGILIFRGQIGQLFRKKLTTPILLLYILLILTSISIGSLAIWTSSVHIGVKIVATELIGILLLVVIFVVDYIKHCLRNSAQSDELNKS